MYCAVIGDIIHSKQIKDRESFQASFKRGLNNINNNTQNDVASNFIVTLGDEFQGLLSSPHRLISIINTIKAIAYPARIRFGIGIGSITTAIDKSASLGADGPAYHHARACLEHIKKSETAHVQPEREILLKSELMPPHLDDTINAIFSLCTLIEKRWRDKQREKISVFTITGSQVDAAKKLGISQPSLYKGLRTAGYNTYMYALDTVQQTLSDSWESRR